MSGQLPVPIPPGIGTRSGGGGIKKITSADATRLTVTTATGTVTLTPKVSPAGIVSAETSATGVALIDGTQTILSVTVPNDGKVHTLLALCGLKNVTTALTGGVLAYHWTLTSGTLFTQPTTGVTVGVHSRNIVGSFTAVTLKPGTTVTVTQSTAMTAGAAKVYAKIVII